MDFSSEEVAEILRLLDATSQDALTIEDERAHVVFRRGTGGGWTQETRTLGSRPVLLLEGAERTKQDIAPATSPPGQAETGVVDIRSPLPGTFYCAPQPGADPFVQVGSRVQVHTVVAIVETMKLMNSIHAGAEGEIVEICVSNGEFIEPAAVLMRIKTARP